MARKKKKKKQNEDAAGFANPDESLGSMRTEGFGDTAAYEESFAPVVGEELGEPMGQPEPPPISADLGTSELDELDDVLVLLPEDDEPVSQDSVALFATESLGDSMGFDDTAPLNTDPGNGDPMAAATDSFSPDPAPAAGPFGADDLGSDPMAPTDSYGGGFNDPLPPPSIDPSGTAAVPGTEAPTGIEDVGLLAQHPDHGEIPVANFDSDSDALGLPDIEDVEDITSLVEEAVSYEMPPPQNDFEDEVAGEEPSYEVIEGSGGGGFGVFLKLVAAAAIVVLGVEFGPGLYEQYLGENSGQTVVADNNTNSGTEASNKTPETTGNEPNVDPNRGRPNGTVAQGATNPTTGTETTSVETVSAAGNAARVELGNWLTEVLASNFGVSSTPSAR